MPPIALKSEFFQKNSHTTICSWKGMASYLDVIVGDKVNQNSAWYYSDPKQAASNIKDYVAFWKGVEISK